MQLLEDVHQRRRKARAGAHGETEAVRLARVVVGVLAEQKHIDVFVGSELQRVVHIPLGREHLVLASLLGYKLREVMEIRLADLIGQQIFPTGGDLVDGSFAGFPGGLLGEETFFRFVS
ncbi:MAG: hypothetical protein JWQ87_3677, partial [Candidatus Sulfotelmatobacter sp.]|nr:hypothetical protein [Candidatus Sulfotelmatobacter sp.]